MRWDAGRVTVDPMNTPEDRRATHPTKREVAEEVARIGREVTQCDRPRCNSRAVAVAAWDTDIYRLCKEHSLEIAAAYAQARRALNSMPEQ